MAVLIGIRQSAFKGEDGSSVTGYNYYLTETDERTVGQTADRVFMTTEKSAPFLKEFKQLQDALGLEVEIRYNRYGKAQSIELV